MKTIGAASWLLLGSLSSFVLACSGSKASSESDAAPPLAASLPAADAAPTSNDGDGAAPITPNGSTPDAGSPGSPDAGGTDAGPLSANLSITSARAQNMGRRGNTLRIAVDGADKAKQTTSLVVRLLDTNGSEVVAFDTTWDGVPDSAQKRFRFDASTAGKATFSGVATIPGVFDPDAPSIAKVGVALEDATGAHSQEVIAPVSLQALAQEFDPCDVLKVTSRCAAGLACSGAPATCRAGTAPALTKVAYVGGANPRMLFRGTEPDDDFASLAIEFLDAAGNPKSVDLIGDGTMSTGFTILGSTLANEGTFFVENLPIAGFDTKVPKLGSTPADQGSHAGARLVTAVAALPTKTSGQACDIDGFDVCASTLACAPGLASATNKCTAITSLRTAKCGAAALLDPAKGLSRAFGKVEGVSLWDAPAGCVTNDAVGRPESTVKLHLTTAATKLTLTTALPETNFDTSIYLLPSCASAGAGALGCNDDVQGASSTLVLSGVAAGDYVIVVDSVSRRGGDFGLSVTVE